MRWKKYTIYTTTEAEDLISLMLNENGVEGVQIEDNVPLSEADTKGMFIDILPELPPDDGSSKVSFFMRLPDDEGSDKTPEAGAAATKEQDRENRQDRAKAAVSDVKVGRDSAVNIEDDAFGSDTDICGADNTAQNGHETDRSSTEDRSYSIDDKIWTEVEIDKLLSTVKAELDDMRRYVDIGEGRIEEGETKDTDWRDNWKKFFKPIRIDDFLIKPSWEEIPAELKPELCDGSLKLIEIDPGTAFGTGSHETTQLCLGALKSYITEGDSVLDIGTGSGILGIGAIKLGAGKVIATELDEMCAPAVMDNIAANGIGEDDFKIIIGNVLGDKDVIYRLKQNATDGYDVVIANILAPVIIQLAGAGSVDTLIRKGGIFITSGIIDTKADDVIAAFNTNPNWEILGVNSKGEWRSVVARRV